MRTERYQFRLDQETRVALSQLANADERTAAAELRWLIRDAAVRRGLWTPKPLRAVEKSSGAA